MESLIHWIYVFIISALLILVIIITLLAISVYRKKNDSKTKNPTDPAKPATESTKVKTTSAPVKNILLIALTLWILVMIIIAGVNEWIYVTSPEHRGHTDPTAHEPIPYKRQGVREIKITEQETLLPKTSPGKEPVFELTSVADIVVIRGEKKLSDGSVERTQAVRFSGRGGKEELPKADDYFIRLESGKESTILWWEK